VTQHLLFWLLASAPFVRVSGLDGFQAISFEVRMITYQNSVKKGSISAQSGAGGLHDGGTQRAQGGGDRIQ
jgi:hypothetical protein